MAKQRQFERQKGAPKLTRLLVKERRKQFEAGEDWALLDAVDFCAHAGMRMPVWLANAFCQRYANWRLFRVRSLDKAFKVERKGARRSERAQREWLKPRVVWQVLRLRTKMAIDDALFELVGKSLDISSSTARDIYYEAKARREFLEAKD